MFHGDKILVDPSIPGIEKAINLHLAGSVDLIQEKDDKREPLYSGIDFFPNGSLAVIDNHNFKFYILNENLEKVGLFKFNNFRQCVCTLSRNEAVVSGGDRVIEFFFISKTNNISMTKTINVTSHYMSICMMNETTFLTCTIEGQNPLRMVTMAGEEKDFNNLPEKSYNIDNCKSTYFHSKNIIVLTDRHDHSVHLYDVRDNSVTRRVVRDEII